MKKPIVTLSLIAGLGLLAACGSDKEVPQDEERPPAATSGTGDAIGDGTGSAMGTDSTTTGAGADTQDNQGY